jgi:hypothetical protein
MARRSKRGSYVRGTDPVFLSQQHLSRRASSRPQAVVVAVEVLGCDTSAYDVSRAIETGGLRVSNSAIAQHQRTLPRQMRNGEDHTTEHAGYDIVTVCHRGRLETGVERMPR